MFTKKNFSDDKISAKPTHWSKYCMMFGTGLALSPFIGFYYYGLITKLSGDKINFDTSRGFTYLNKKSLQYQPLPLLWRLTGVEVGMICAFGLPHFIPGGLILMALGGIGYMVDKKKREKVVATKSE